MLLLNVHFYAGRRLTINEKPSESLNAKNWGDMRSCKWKRPRRTWLLLGCTWSSLTLLPIFCSWGQLTTSELVRMKHIHFLFALTKLSLGISKQKYADYKGGWTIVTTQLSLICLSGMIHSSWFGRTTSFWMWHIISGCLTRNFRVVTHRWLVLSVTDV